jgi:Protein of unknown function (DUF3237)
MPGITTVFLFKIALEVPVLALGETPYGERRVARFDGGNFEGPKLKGIVLPGGGGWMLLRSGACSTLKFGLSSRPTTSK